MKLKKLSIIIPVYNEQDTIEKIVHKVMALNLPCAKEIIIVNDSSKDQSGQIIKKMVKKNSSIKYIEHKINTGKGGAVNSGLKNSTGDHVVIQDADLEYNPQDILTMVESLNDSDQSVVYGSRLFAKPVFFGRNKTPFLLHYFGNKMLSLITSCLYGSWITDMETCYKLFPKKAMDSIKLKARGFELEPEITAKLLKNGYKITEIPITTNPRGYEQGKKLNTWTDGTKALWTLIKYRFTN